MAAAEVKEVDGLLDRINKIYRIELEEAFDVGDFNRQTLIAEVEADPIDFGRACGNKSLGAAEAKALDGANKRFLPSVIFQADWIVAALRHPMDVSAPERRPPKAGLPGAMNPHFIRRSQLAHLRPRRKRYLVPFAALRINDHPRNISGAVPLLPSSANVKDLHLFTLQHMPTTSTFSLPKTSSTARVTPKRGLGLP